MRRTMLVAAIAALTAPQLSAQISVSAQAAGAGVDLVNGGFQIPAGTDITAGYQQTLGSPSAGGSGTFGVVQTAGVVRATLSTGVTAQGFGLSISRAQVQVAVVSQTPMMVDVSLTILNEYLSSCSPFQPSMGSGTASAQLIGFGPLTNEHCNPSFFDPCTFTFEPMLLDANGLTFEMVADAIIVGGGFRCPPLQTADFACAIEVRPSAVVQPFGMACGADLTATTTFAMPGLFDIEVRDPGASIAVLLVGVDQIALPFLGCTLSTTPVASVPLTLDASGSAAFRVGLPQPPFAFQAVTLEGSAFHLSQGLFARP